MGEVFYWRDRGREVDFVVSAHRRLTAIEVKSGRASTELPGMSAFTARFEPDRVLLVGSGGIPFEEFLGAPVGNWVGGR
jgi:predicted AAA+ superfamily ATPase